MGLAGARRRCGTAGDVLFGDHSRPKGVNLEVERISIPLKEDVYLSK